jgi:hypothetical protein
MATTIGNVITLDGQFTDWPAADSLMTPTNTVGGYQVFGALLNDATLGNTYVIGIDATVATDPVIGANTFIYLDTDQNRATGYSPFGSVGAEYEVQFSPNSIGVVQPYLYSVTSTGVTTQLNGGAPLNFGVSSNGESVELAIPQALLTPAGGTAPKSINFDALINNGAAALPADFTNPPQYVITDPSTLVPVNSAIKKVGIVYSATTAALFFGGGQTGQTAYSDLFMAAQHQAEAAGVSYDLLTEADLTNVAKLSQYSALVFPDMEDVQSSQVSSIANALNQVVYNYHVPIITAGNFMTNDQTGAPLPGNSYANMQALLNVTLGGSGTATYTVTPDATALANHNPILAGYTAGEHIGGASGQFAGTTVGSYTNTGYLTFSGVTQPATTLADINIQGGATLPGVVQTHTGGTNTVFATTGLLGDSNLLQHAIQNAVFGTAPSLSLDVTRMAGVVDSRTDLDQSQFPSDVSPGAGQPGIYDALIPILQQWKQQYNFVGSFFTNIGDNANPANQNFTNWAVSAPYYRTILAMGSEIGNHSYTHLINPPTVDANGNPVPLNSLGGSTWSENTNTLYVTPPANGSAPNWTFNYEFGQSKTIEQQNIGITIAGAAVPGANDTMATAEQIMNYYQTVAGGLTGYVSGGWTGVGSGYPNAFGYLTPSDTGSVYIAPNITFDFTEVQYQNKTAAQALADWESLFNQLSTHSQVPVIVWPWHDFGATNWDTSGTGSGPGYTQQMFADFIAYAFNKGYEFVTSETLAARIAAEQKATLSETTNGNVITATVTPDPTAPDLGAMALNVINGAVGQTIQNAGNWYAYNQSSIFLPHNGGTFNVTLGTTQDDVTHIDALPMRADLQSVTGNGTNLTFAMTGDGLVDIHVKTPGANIISIQGAPAATLTGDDLALTFNDGPLAVSSTSPQGVPVLHTVSVSEGTNAVLSTGTNILFGGSGTNVLHLTGLLGQYKFTVNADGSDTIQDLRAGTPDGTDIIHNFQSLQFADGSVLSTAQLTGTVIESLGSTSLVQVGNNFYLDAVSSGTGPTLKYAGTAVLTGQFAPYVPVAAEQTATGYEIAWKNSGTNQFSIWNTDSNGNEMSYSVYAGTSLALESLETSFHQDLNGDGVIGLPPGTTVVESFGSTSLVQVGNNFYLDAISSGTGPTLKYAGTAVLTGQFAPYVPVAAEQTATGYEVAWKNGTNQFSIWNTDSNGNEVSYSVYAGTSVALDSLETSFHQDLNGDGVIGLPPGTTVIESFGSTSLVRVGSNYFFDSNSSGGTELKYGGAPVVAGQFGAYTPVGVEATGTGYELAWKNASTNQFSIWNTDSNGNEVSYSVYSGTSTALESLETSFHQDLNGDGVIGVPKGQTIVDGPGNDILTGGPGADTFVFTPINPTTTHGVYDAGFGKDVITNFTADATNSNHDVLQLSSSMFATGTTATALVNGTAHNVAGGAVTVVQSGSNVVITVDPTDSITLNHLALSVLKTAAAADIHFA